MIINKVWFKNKDDDGVIHPEFSKNDIIPMATIAFVLTVVSFNFLLLTILSYSIRLRITLTSGSLAIITMSLSLWQPTRRNTVATSNVSWNLRRKHAMPIHSTPPPTHAQGCSVCLYLISAITKLISMFRNHAKVSGDRATQASNISDTEIEAAKQEWAGLVLSDDE